MDKVKGVIFKSPFESGIVDFEADVGRDPLGLVGGEIGSDYFGIGELVGKIAELEW